MAYNKSTKTRNQLLEATSHLLRVKGYTAMGLNDIIQKSEIPKGSLYHHFPGGKEELSAAAIRLSNTKMIATLNRLVEKSGGIVGGIRAFCNYYIEQLETSDFRMGCPLATVALETAHGAPLVQVACSEAFEAQINLMSRHLENHDISPDHAHSTSVMTLSSLEGALLLAKAHNNTDQLSIVRDQLIAQLEKLITKTG